MLYFQGQVYLPLADALMEFYRSDKVANTINAEHVRRMMGKSDVTLSNTQRLFCIPIFLIGCIFYDIV